MHPGLGPLVLGNQPISELLREDGQKDDDRYPLQAFVDDNTPEPKINELLLKHHEHVGANVDDEHHKVIVAYIVPGL